MALRRSIPTFELANPIYVGAVVYFYTVDDTGAKTTTLATLYDAAAGTGTLANPQTLDSKGKFQQPVYIESPVVASVTGLTVDDHDTGIIAVPGTNRGQWATATLYYAGEIVVAGSNADSTQDIYAVDYTHTSVTFATDVSNGYLSKLVDVSVLADLFTIPATAGNALKFLRVNAGGTASEWVAAATVLSAIGALAAANNLSDLADAPTAQGNLGLGSAAVENTGTSGDNVPLLSGANSWSGVQTLVGKSLEFAEGAAVASAAGSTDIWSAADGQTVHITGTNAITDFGTAPQAGAMRFCVADAAFTLTNGANLICPGGSNIVAAAGDCFLVYAETTTISRIKYYTRAGATAGLLDVQQTVKTDTFTTSSTSLTDITGLSASITPKSTNSKVLVRASLSYGDNSAASAMFALLRGSTQIGQGDAASNRLRVNAGATNADAGGLQSICMEYLDSPATVASTTYKVQMAMHAAAAGYINRSETDTDTALFPRASSTLTLMEIGL